MNNKNKMVSILGSLLISVLLVGCIATTSSAKKDEDTKKNAEVYKPVKTVASYEEAGKWWGGRHLKQNSKPGNIDDAFVGALVEGDNLNFFWVHADLKDAFKKGYRFGYQDRAADLVLGPNLTEAAARIGEGTAKRFVEVINGFEKGWADTLSRAIDVFITLISEGSQADRERFIKKFTEEYTAKYNTTQEILQGGGFMTQMSEGGTMLHIDARKTLAILDIPRPETLKTEIYHQTFRVMGDEWGKRLSHNLIKRDELMDLLRRSKTALQEVPASLSSNLGIVHDAFVVSYGTDATNVFMGLLKDAGYSETPVSKPYAGSSSKGTPLKKR